MLCFCGRYTDVGHVSGEDSAVLWQPFPHKRKCPSAGAQEVKRLVEISSLIRFVLGGLIEVLHKICKGEDKEAHQISSTIS